MLEGIIKLKIVVLREEKKKKKRNLIKIKTKNIRDVYTF